MRFAISLLVLVAVAAVVGMVLQQNKDYTGYLVEFGPFWFGVYKTLGVFNVYGTVWFMGILGFLVVSTSACIFRHTPGFWRDMRTFREHASLASLSQFQHRAILPTRLTVEAQVAVAGAYFKRVGWRFRRDVRDTDAPRQVLAGKKGSANRLGYFFAHLAIVLICVGGLLDGQLMTYAAMWFGDKSPETRPIFVKDVPEKSWLSTANPTFRGNVSIPEGGTADYLSLSQGEGYLMQRLPFNLTLKRFVVDYYPSGQPKLFASDVSVTDKATGKTQDARITVNHPLVVGGISIYQASFGDGGSPLILKQWPLLSGALPSVVAATSQNSQTLRIEGKPYTVELGDFRLFNLEDFNKPGLQHGDTRFDKAMSVQQVRQLKNLGPSIQFKLRDAAGQAREYINYMQPVLLDGQWYFLSGMRQEVGAAFQYFRFPADANNEADTFMAIQARLSDPAGRDALAALVSDQLVGKATTAGARKQFSMGIGQIIARFVAGGLPALEAGLPTDPAVRKQFAAPILAILRAAIITAHTQVAGQSKPALTENFVNDSLVAMSASHDYGAGAYLQLKQFQHVQSSVFQMTRSPGRVVVYVGCLLLILGVFAMLYIRERRVWIVCQDAQVWVCMAANRKGSQFEQEFKLHANQLEMLLQTAAQDTLNSTPLLEEAPL